MYLPDAIASPIQRSFHRKKRRRLLDIYLALTSVDLRLRTKLYAIWLISCWPRNFVKRTDSLTTRFNRAYDRQRALCEDPVLINSWFKLVEETKAKYGICDEDVYNFDEAGL